MGARHQQLDRYFEEQFITCSRYIIPQLQQYKALNSSTQILEVGCGIGGNLAAFKEYDCQVTGIDIREKSIEVASEKLQKKLRSSDQLVHQDIYNFTKKQFDIIFLKDTIEHIPDQHALVKHLKSLLKPDGIIFFAFPPWRNPFGGHQQVCHSKYLSKLPWFHLLPRKLFKLTLKLFKEADTTIQDLLVSVYDTRISIRTFRKICLGQNLRINWFRYYLINPNYQVKFNLKPRTLPIFMNLNGIRDFYTTTAYFIVSQQK